MRSIDEWLARHGLSEYQDLFREHKIDLDNLSSVKESDLKELEVPLGDRKRIVNAILQFRGPRAGRPPEGHTPTGLVNRERRLLVVLFCDLVGSTRYATRLDPEDLEKILHPYRETVRSIIERHNGLTLIYEGDGIKAYFGSRVASEDDQEQTLSAALEIRDTVSGMNLENAEALSVRIGVATGTVIIGDFDAPTGPHAFGEALHLASRLQTQAEPGSILVDHATHHSMQSVFDFADEGRHFLKGFDDPVQTWKLIGKKKVDSRFAKHFRNTRLVGRTRELEKLVKLWLRAREEGRGAVITLYGEAGIGKSRLAHELQRIVADELSTTLFFQCSPYHTDSVYFPVLETIGHAIGLSESVSEKEKLVRLGQFLSACDVPLEYSMRIFVGLFALDKAVDGESELSESMQEEVSKNVLTNYILSLAGKTPVFVLVEDVHWIDATSREFFRHFSHFCADHPVVLLMTSRESVPEGGDTIVDLSLSLGRLKQKESRQLLEQLCAGRSVPAEFRTYIERKAEGVPLFIEELTSTILDTGLKDNERAAALEEGQGFEMSGILQSSLLSKLDRLGDTKEVAELAALIGRDFRVDVLQGVLQTTDSALRESLQKLVDAEIIFESKTSSAPSYTFKHALIQDTARNLLSRKRREATHLKIATVLEQILPRLANAEPELIAYHCSEGGDHLKASEYWFAAGRRTGRTWAKQEALHLLRKGLASLFQTPESRRRLLSELDFQLEIGDVLYAAYGYITVEGEQAYERALQLCDLLDDHESAVRALDGLFGIHFNSCRFDETIEISDRLIAIGEDRGNLSGLVLGMQFKGMSLFCKGEFEAADELLQGALEHIERADEIGSDFPSMALIYLSWTRYIRDVPEQAVRCYQEARSIVKVQAPYRKAACLGDGCILYALMDRPDEVDVLAAELLPLSERYGFNLWLNIGRFLQGWSASRKGREQGLEQMKSMLQTLGDQEIDKTFYLGLLAQAYANFDQHDAALETAELGLAQAQRTGERYYVAELLRIKAGLVRRKDDGAVESRSLFEQAIECARSQGAVSWLKRAESDLADTPMRLVRG